MLRSGSGACSRRVSADPTLKSPIVRGVFGFGAVDLTKPYKIIGFGAIDVTKPYKMVGVFLLRLGSCLALGRRFSSPSPIRKWPVIKTVLLWLGRLLASGKRPRLRNTSRIQHDLILDPGSPQKAAREPPRDKPKDQCWASRFGAAPILQKRPDMMKQNLLENVHTSKAPGPCEPNRDADPTLSTTRAVANHI